MELVKPCSENYMNSEILFTMSACFINIPLYGKGTEIHRATNSEVILVQLNKCAMSTMPNNVVFATNTSWLEVIYTCVCLLDFCLFVSFITTKKLRIGRH